MAVQFTIELVDRSQQAEATASQQTAAPVPSQPAVAVPAPQQPFAPAQGRPATAPAPVQPPVTPAESLLPPTRPTAPPVLTAADLLAQQQTTAPGTAGPGPMVDPYGKPPMVASRPVADPNYKPPALPVPSMRDNPNKYPRVIDAEMQERGQSLVEMGRTLQWAGFRNLGGMMSMSGHNLQNQAAGRESATPGIAMVAMASNMIGQALKGAALQVQSFGNVIATAARGDNFQALGLAVDSAVSAVEKIPVVGSALAGALSLAVAPVKSFVSIVEGFVQRGKELSSYSGPLAYSTAMAEVQKELADFREAQAIGPEMARLTDAWSRAQTNLQDALIPLKKAVLEAITPAIEWIADVLKDIDIKFKIGQEMNAKFFEAVLAFVAGKGIGQALDFFVNYEENLLKIAAKYADELERRKNRGDPGLMKNVYDILGGDLPIRPGGPVRAFDAAGAGLNIPLINNVIGP